jgi:hypothetical protein
MKHTSFGQEVNKDGTRGKLFEGNMMYGWVLDPEHKHFQMGTVHRIYIFIFGSLSDLQRGL